MRRNTYAAVPQRKRFRTVSGTLVRFGYLPFMLVGVDSVGIWMASAGAPKSVVHGVLLVAVGCSFAAERVVPYEPTWNRDRGDTRRDVAHALVNESLQIGSLLTLPVLVGWFGLRGVWPSGWPFVIQVLGAVLVLDAGLTVGHWASHVVPMLWRFHAVHHSVERFYGFNGLMKHPLHQLFETAVGTAPLVLLGLPSEVAAALVFLVAVQLLLQHSNVDYAVGPLRRVLSLNQIHRFHHLRWAGVGDVNFGLFTTIWDRLLGTAVWDPDKRFTSADIGIAKRQDFPVGYLDQLADPFRSHLTNESTPEWCFWVPTRAEPARSPACGDVRDPDEGDTR
jgi:sterol desaturase/sphingolipid hydroxylase (fatty acid hydroxylase superfamily)